MSIRSPGSIPFGEDWGIFIRRKDPKRRLAFFDTFLAMALDGWTYEEGDDSTEDQRDDYDRMSRLMGNYLNGKSGGRPKKNITPSKTPCETPFETGGKPEGRMEGIDMKEEVCKKRPSKTPTLKQFLAGAITAGVPADFATSLHTELESAGWADGKGLPIGNWRRYLKTAWNDEQKKIAARAVEVERDRLIDYDGVI